MAAWAEAPPLRGELQERHRGRRLAGHGRGANVRVILQYVRQGHSLVGLPLCSREISPAVVAAAADDDDDDIVFCCLGRRKPVAIEPSDESNRGRKKHTEPRALGRRVIHDLLTPPEGLVAGHPQSAPPHPPPPPDRYCLLSLSPPPSLTKPPELIYLTDPPP